MWGEMSPERRGRKVVKGLSAVQEGPLALTLCEVGAVEGFRAEEWRSLTGFYKQAAGRKWRC